MMCLGQQKGDQLSQKEMMCLFIKLKEMSPFVFALRLKAESVWDGGRKGVYFKIVVEIQKRWQIWWIKAREAREGVCFKI